MPGGMTVIYKNLIASGERTRQVITDVAAVLGQGTNCLDITNWTSHLQAIADALRGLGHDPVTLKGGMGAKDRAAVLARLIPSPAAHPCSPSRPARTPGKGSTARLWTPCSSPRPSRARDASCSTPEGFSVLMTKAISLSRAQTEAISQIPPNTGTAPPYHGHLRLLLASSDLRQ